MRRGSSPQRRGQWCGCKPTAARPQALRSQRAAMDAENGSLPWAKQAIHPLTPTPSIEVVVPALGHQGPLRKSGAADFVAGDASAAGAPKRPKSRRTGVLGPRWTGPTWPARLGRVRMLHTVRNHSHEPSTVTELLSYVRRHQLSPRDRARWFGRDDPGRAVPVLGMFGGFCGSGGLARRAASLDRDRGGGARSKWPVDLRRPASESARCATGTRFSELRTGAAQQRHRT